MKILDEANWSIFKENCLRTGTIDAFYEVANVILDYYCTTDKRLFLAEAAKDVVYYDGVEIWALSRPYKFLQFVETVSSDWIVYTISVNDNDIFVHGCTIE